MQLQTFVHAQGALQLLDNTLVKGYLLPEVGLHHVSEVHLPLLMEVAHLCLEGKPNRPAALPDAVRLALVHLPLVTHPLALLHLGKGTWIETTSPFLKHQKVGSNSGGTADSLRFTFRYPREVSLRLAALENL